MDCLAHSRLTAIPSCASRLCLSQNSPASARSRSNHWQGFALCGFHPHSRKTWKKRLEQMFSLFFKVIGQRWIRTTVPSREQIYSLSPLATRPPTLILFSNLPLTRFELVASPLPRECATPAPQRLNATRAKKIAGNRNRTYNLRFTKPLLYRWAIPATKLMI